MLRLTPTWCGPLTTPKVLNLTPEFLQCKKKETIYVRDLDEIKNAERVADCIHNFYMKKRYMDEKILYYNSTKKII